MHRIAGLAAVLACAACELPANPPQVAALPGAPQSLQGQPQAQCQEFRAPLTAGGQPEQATGQACRQPDGSWHIVQNTPGLPSQNYVVPAPTAAAAPPPANPAPCSTVTVPVTVGGQQQMAVVESCQQPDGSWRVTQNTPGLPPQVYVVPPLPADYGYPYGGFYSYPLAYPYWFDNPWFFGLGPTIFVFQRFPHFQNGFDRGFHHGFGHGFGHGGFQRAGGMGGGHHR